MRPLGQVRSRCYRCCATCGLIWLAGVLVQRSSEENTIGTWTDPRPPAVVRKRATIIGKDGICDVTGAASAADLASSCSRRVTGQLNYYELLQIEKDATVDDIKRVAQDYASHAGI